MIAKLQVTDEILLRKYILYFTFISMLLSLKGKQLDEQFRRFKTFNKKAPFHVWKSILRLFSFKNMLF